MAEFLPIDYTTKDYEAFRNDMINLIPIKLPNWTDYSSSDTGIVLLELFAYCSDILSYYQDRIANEVYLATATQKRSVIDICRLIGYRLSPAVPSTTNVVFQIIPSASSNTVIPKGFSISTQQTQYEDAITFETDTDLIIPAGNTGMEQSGGVYTYKVSATQGITIRDEVLGSSNGSSNQSFSLKYPSVINSGTGSNATIEVYVNEGAGFELWTNATELIANLPVTGKYYTTEEDEDGITSINFGDGSSTGKIPAIGVDNIKVNYRIGGGLSTNVGSGKITVLQSSQSNVLAVTNIIAATGGYDSETIEEARVNAPNFLKTSSRAVTKNDYETLAKTIDGVAKAYAEIDSVNGSLVNVTIAPVGGGLPTSTLQQTVYDYLSQVKIISTQVSIKEPLYVSANLTLTIDVSSSYNQAEVETYVTEVLKSEFDFSNREFGIGEFASKIYQLINPISGVNYVEIDRMTILPRVDWKTVSGNPTWSTVFINSTNTLVGNWKVVMTSATAFNVLFDTAGNGTYSTSKGSGVFGTTFTSTGGEVTFTITVGTIACVNGDYWIFRTTKYNGNITVSPNEILLLNEGDLQLNMQGGWV